MYKLKLSEYEVCVLDAVVYNSLKSDEIKTKVGTWGIEVLTSISRNLKNRDS